MKAVTNFFRVTMLWVLFVPYVVYYLGAASNQLVLIANRDKFPVMWNARVTARAGADSYGMIDDTHCLMTKETRLNFLGDIIDLHSAWYSIGDGLIYIGEWLEDFSFYVWVALVIQELRRTNERQTTSGPRTS
jgi:hypothetical protein